MIPLIALGIVLFGFRAQLPYSDGNRYLFRLAQLNMSILFLEALAWVINGIPGQQIHIGLWVINGIYFVITIMMGYFWLEYVSREIYGWEIREGKLRRAVLFFPIVLIVVLVLFSLWTSLIFEITEDNFYSRGSLHFIHPLIGIGYLVGATILAFYNSTSGDKEERQKKRRMAGFALAPIIGASIQAVFLGSAVLWPFAAIALIIIFLGLSSEQLYMDGLTGLNNRGGMNQFLQKRCELARDNSKRKVWYFVLIDVNDFKIINDRYGHVVGDKVLRFTADHLKQLMKNRKSFLARYGGDEFAIVVECENDEEIEKVMVCLKPEGGICYSHLGKEHKVTLSAGYARFRKGMKAEQIIEEADHWMYYRKKNWKKTHPGNEIL